MLQPTVRAVSASDPSRSNSRIIASLSPGFPLMPRILPPRGCAHFLCISSQAALAAGFLAEVATIPAPSGVESTASLLTGGRSQNERSRDTLAVHREAASPVGAAKSAA